MLDLLQVQEDATLVFYDDDFGLVRMTYEKPAWLSGWTDPSSVVHCGCFPHSIQKSTRLWWVFRHFGFPKEQLKVRVSSIPYPRFLSLAVALCS